MSELNHIYEIILERLETDKNCRLMDIEYLKSRIKDVDSGTIKEYYEVLLKHNEEKIKTLDDNISDIKKELGED